MFKISYMEKENISHRIKQLRTRLGYNQEQLGKAVGVSHVTISQWESEATTPKAKYLTSLSKSLKVSLEYLLHGIDKNVEQGPDLRGTVPLISWIQAGKWLETEVREMAGDYQQYATTANVGPRGFALRVLGDSMTSFTGGKTIPEGSIVVVDPDIAVTSGKVVVARLDGSGESTLKQYIEDGGQKYLKPFNPTYPIMQVNGNCTIIGVVRQVIQEF
ncbi:LexA family protein [Arsukibacterium indicum]|uniref:Helix-turn-helix domain-containing protein n=1 Tax=Arsukibacterium indicum TaxID=2848612 RepID=A0ABS6MH99_9GAMM|nr:S24 family peptidase [Arsukibacterium indicum]MBV2128187.1 helix-turn-helix domain-containing protein [Arsukibacterium indicum]